MLLYEQMFEQKYADCMQCPSECSHSLRSDICVLYKVNMICFYFYFWVTMNHWVWLEVSESQKLLLAHGGLYYKEVNVYLSWWQQVGSVSWSVHFKRTMTWAISIIILYRSLNDQENSHDFRYLTAISVKTLYFASLLVASSKFISTFLMLLF